MCGALLAHEGDGQMINAEATPAETSSSLHPLVSPDSVLCNRFAPPTIRTPGQNCGCDIPEVLPSTPDIAGLP